MRTTMDAVYLSEVERAQLRTVIGRGEAPDAGRIVLVIDQLNTHSRPRSTKPSRRPKPSAWPTSRKSITRPNMAAG